ncbi:uncharacterized protein N7500_001028 [Penicillium coprophilum]|uniref:uncharacterized protein n=1 Tax=Penicillium coprophilum TaxID=36646 RepID=UPI00239F6F5A|nr:uncharacterized protein N7500_001028 [Penicillium coprophilum]KAJ5178329.1 hypothetical protein N7500_001028 [Penicillium coprophilum]
MSFLSIRVASRQAMRTNLAVPAATFHSSAARRFKEDDQNRDDLATYYEAQKQQVLKGIKEGTAKWKYELASNSEADVKADRGELDDEDVSFEEWQQKTKHVKSQK